MSDVSGTARATLSSTAARWDMAFSKVRPHIGTMALVPAIGLAVLIGTILNPVFLSSQNLINVLQQSSELAVLVIGETLVLIVGMFDLSLESVVGLGPMVAAWVVLPAVDNGGGIGLSPYLGILIIFVVGACVGLVNGLLVVKLKLEPFIVTLAMLILLRGIVVGLSNGSTLYDLPSAMIYIGSANWLGVPVSIWLAGLLYILVGLFLRYHSFGRSMYAIGGNRESARAAGLRVDRVTIIVYVAAGFFASVAGLMLAGRLASVASAQGQNLIFFVFAAAVIGGISLQGGRGSLFGALTGVLLLGIIQNILTLSRVPSFWIDAVFGGVILVALVLSRLASLRST
jgi:simple sugar transport system permease protein